MSAGAPNARVPLRPVFDSRAVRLICGVLLGFEALLFVAGLARGGTLLSYKEALAHDFIIFWTAGRFALAGKAAAVYRWEVIGDLLGAAPSGGASLKYVTRFFYPPMFFIAVAPLGLLPYAAAAVAWLAANVAAYLAAIRAILPGGTALIAALAAPTVMFNCVTGQNGLLSAALLGGALAVLDIRPVAGGVLIGLLAYKPQFGVLLPLFLIVTGRWRVFAAAALTIAVLSGIAAALFGLDAYAAFLGAMPNAGDAYFRHANLRGQIGWDHLASLYGLLRTAGVAAAPAWAAHLLVALAAAAASLWIAAGPAPYPLKAAALATASVIVTPYSELNDLAILNVAMAFLVRDGLARRFHWAESAALAAAYAWPLAYMAMRPLLHFLGPQGEAPPIGLGPVMCAILAGLIASRLARTAPQAAVAPAPVQRGSSVP